MSQYESLKAEIRDVGEEARRNRAASYDSTMMVSIQSYEERVPIGIFVSFYYNHTYHFHGLDQMLLTMDDMMEAASMPQAVPERKSLGGAPYEFQELDPDSCLQELGSIPRLPNGKAAFMLRFYRRQNGSIQGELAISTQEGDRKVAFRSALELMRLLYEYLDMELGDGSCPAKSWKEK